MIDAINLIRNIGIFDSVSSGAQLPLDKFALIYAENGRGKTTLAAILRSLASGDPLPILERRRLGAQHPAHVVIAGNSAQKAVFENGAWTNAFNEVVVFDDHFVSENVCSGIKVESDHRQNLHELIIGAKGVTLNQTLQQHIDRIEQHNRALQAKSNTIPVDIRGGLSIDDYCALEECNDIDDAFQVAERNLAAARQADQVRQRTHFMPFSLPEFNLESIEQLLARGLPELESEAAGRVQEHIAKLGDGGEVWIGDGVSRIEAASIGADYEACPFCSQDLAGSPLIAHYQAYFSVAYDDLRRAIARSIQELNTTHSGDIQAAFERSISSAEQTRQFWKSFTEVPELTIDTVEVARAWKEAFEAVAPLLKSKQASPLDPLEIDNAARQKVTDYHTAREQVEALSNAFTATREQIDLVKEKAAVADISALEHDLTRLKASKARYRQNIVALCDAYLKENADKTATENLRDEARADLDLYRKQVFPEYEDAINKHLQRFNAGFRLGKVRPVNTRSGSTCDYGVLINTVTVPLASKNPGDQAFKNTLSAGDRNALALAFFFASLELDPYRNQRVVVIDDPKTSLDEHRSLTTIQEMRRLADDVAQLIVLSHSKPFLCDLWQGADSTHRSACRIVRGNIGSTFAEWEVNQDCISEHDRRHSTVREYIKNSVGADERAVASTLRPILEAFVRVAYPEWFPPGSLLGQFIGLCEQKDGTPEEILSSEDRAELRRLLDYANLFHHDTNATWQTVIINDHELVNFAKRTVAFTKR